MALSLEQRGQLIAFSEKPEITNEEKRLIHFFMAHYTRLLVVAQYVVREEKIMLGEEDLPSYLVKLETIINEQV
jgi:hypothetical protein